MEQSFLHGENQQGFLLKKMEDGYAFMVIIHYYHRFFTRSENLDSLTQKTQKPYGMESPRRSEDQWGLLGFTTHLDSYENHHRMEGYLSVYTCTTLLILIFQQQKLWV